ncbi:MAG: glycosyl hydrolase [Candidatus Kapabacteria bacterium]|nr:glycosyl hydrolase [Candidatus Kapabacteria bacterium]
MGRTTRLLAALCLCVAMYGLNNQRAQAQAPSSSAFSAIRARNIGPAIMSGRVSDIAVVDTAPKKIYVGAAGGGIWKSTNGGLTFTPIFDEYPQSIGAIEIDQARPDTVWVGTGEPWTRNSVSVGEGLFRTTDAGKTWSKIGLDSTERIAMIAIDPNTPSTVFVAAPGPLFNDSEHRGLYRTTDFGATWTKVLAGDGRTGCTDVVIDPTNPKIMLASMWSFRRTPHSFTSGGPGGGIYRSTDGGASWTKMSKGLPSGDVGRVALAMSPKDPNLVFASVEAKESGLYASTDGGVTWTRRYVGGAVDIRPFYFSRIVCDPNDTNVIYKHGVNLFRSDDGGMTFGTVANSAHSDHHAVWIDPANSEHLVIGTDGGVFESFDKGRAVRFFPNLPLGQFYHVTVDDQQPYKVYGGLQDNSSWFGPSRKPGGIVNGDWTLIGGGDGFHVAVDRGDPNIVFWESQGGNIVRTNTKTGQSKTVAPKPDDGSKKLRYNWNSPIVRGYKPGVVYVGSQYVHRSTNLGETWKRISPDLTTNDAAKLSQEQSGGLTVDNSSAENHCTVFTIAESPRKESIIWAGTDDGNLQVTTNGGSTWRNVTANVSGLPKSTWVSCVEPSIHADGTCFVTFDGHMTGDMKTYVYVTTDMGASWKPLATPYLRGYAHVIRQDPRRAESLYLGTENGLYVSNDAGSSWIHFRNKLPMVAVRDLAVQSREEELVVATHGRGIYIIDDLDVLRSFDPKSLTSELMIIPPRPIPRTYGVPGSRWFGGDADFVGESKSQSPRVWYMLKDKHMRGSFVLRLKDAAGKVIRTLPASTRKGLNFIDLPISHPAPIAPRSKVGGAFGTLTGPILDVGTYTLEFDRAGQIATVPITIVSDTTLGFTAEEMKQQSALMKDLTRMFEDLAVTTHRIQSAVDSIAGRADVAAAVRDSLVALNATLVNTRPGMMGLTGEEQLRETISGLYAEVNGYLGRPGDTQLIQAKSLADLVKKAKERGEELVKGIITESREQSEAYLRTSRQ